VQAILSTVPVCLVAYNNRLLNSHKYSYSVMDTNKTSYEKWNGSHIG
jgi:hypothetical protein